MLSESSMEVRVVDEGKGRCLFVVACFPCGEVSRSICARRLVSQPWLAVCIWPVRCPELEQSKREGEREREPRGTM